eukprot:CAMPEP_0170646740 /NCGR_PEP_ID=MMETSP0224-20130122/43801_1 /TAXON_ID=285029 /ORGANISM="Togula jolla, Strain CCCM 725" /LENGTH=153 /DNA_ID=CAMNT_0010978097 /DNA_START=66 /DNA_END=524 /DNA_ORIENTATION=+
MGKSQDLESAKVAKHGRRNSLSQTLLAPMLRRSASSNVSAMFEKHEWAEALPVSQSKFDWQPSKAYNPWRSDVIVPILLGATTLAGWWYKASSRLTGESYFTVFVTLQSLFLLVKQSPPDVTLILATLTLRLSGVLDDAEAWGGFSNTVVLSV